MLSICGCITYACSSQDRGDVTHDPGYAMVSTDPGNISGFRRQAAQLSPLILMDMCYNRT